MMPRLHLLLFVLAAFSIHDVVHAAGDGEATPWEWEGTFKLTKGETYTWSAARNKDNVYADPMMKLVVIPASGGRRLSGDADEEAHEMWEKSDTTWTTVRSGGMLDIAPTGTAFNLEFNQESWVSLFYIQPPTNGSYVFFAEHGPTEFENEFHYLRDKRGDDVEPEGADEEPEAVSGLGVAIGAAALTATPGLLMIALVGPLVQRIQQGEIIPAINSFASGAIFACAVFLLLPEGLHLAGAGHMPEDEVTGSWTWGTGILVGWILGVIIHHISSSFGHSHSAKGNQDAEAGGEVLPKQVDLAVAGPVLFGDAFHNLVDGLVIGFSAKACSVSALWSVVAATFAHEAVQEVADFIVLLTKANLEWKRALACNFLSALPSTVLGAIIAHQVKVSKNWEGILLAFGAGVYLFVAISELAPSVVDLPTNKFVGSLLRLGSFAVGAIAIGLVLIGHEHCEGGDGHAHGHRL